ncbi:6-bladed beta-propeller [Bacillus marasmi]|uniref:6-bladed beta-propeller n=1 Tax=Bacillus marasmi TaxID=1926279 RepID=UPI0011C771EB|nr:6-bladed beta-propeller [Bacillus marasmi]
MKKKTVYIWMSTVVGLTVALYAGIYFLDLQAKVKPIVASANPTGEVEFRSTIFGTFEEPLKKPMDVAKVGEYIYVSDTGNKQIQVFDQSGTPITKFGKKGTKEGEFQFPYGIDGDEQGNVYVADMYNGKISVFNSKGEFQHYFKETGKETLIKAPGGLRIVDNKIYVTDIEKHKVFVFGLDGEKVAEIGGAGTGEGQFIAPNSVAVDEDQNVYVSDSGNNRVQVFNKDGKFEKIINGSKDGKGQSSFVNPRGIGVDGRGNVYIVNNLSHNIYVYDKDGNQENVLGGMGSNNDQLYLPNGLYVDERGTIFVTDTINQRVSVFY